MAELSQKHLADADVTTTDELQSGDLFLVERDRVSLAMDGGVISAYADAAAASATSAATSAAAGIELATDAIVNTQHAVELTHLEQIATKTILGNPTNAIADPIAMLGTDIPAIMGQLFTRSADIWSIEIPTDGETLIVKGGRVSITAPATSANVEFHLPFPGTRMNAPIVSVASGSAEINVEAADTYTVGGATAADGFTVTVSEWDAATSLWVAPAGDVIISWIAVGY